MRKPPEGLVARLLDSLPDVYTLVIDHDQRVSYANASFLEHFGLKWTDLAGISCRELGSPFLSADNHEVGFCPTEWTPVYPASALLTRMVRDKKYVYETSLFRLGDGDPWSMWSFHDLTERFDLESQVRRLDELEYSLVQAAMDGIVVNDMLGNILLFNEGAARILGYAPEEVLGKLKVSTLYPENVAHHIKQLIYDPDHGGVGILENFETTVRQKNGSLIPIWLSARILHEGDREVGIVGYFRDLRERKQLEEEVLRNERLAALGRMVAHVSHEIKNPLATIGGFAAQLERNSALAEDARRKLTLIRQEVQRLEKFLADLTTFTRGAAPQKIPGDLLAVIAEIAELLEPGFKERDVRFHLEAPTEIPQIPFDPGQMRQVFINLFKNALEAMPLGGDLTVAAGVEDGYLVIKVTDTGQGIAPDHLKMLFTPFFSTKEGGTGLGLTICRGLIAQHQGEISLESEPGRGATCTIRLPLSPA